MPDMKNTAEKIQQLREISGFGITHCRLAFKQARGNMDKAIAILRGADLAIVRKKFK